MKHHNRSTSRKVIPFRSSAAPAYPNQAMRSYRISRVLDYAVTAAATVGFVSALMFLFVLL